MLTLLLVAFTLAHTPPATKTLTLSDSGKTVTLAAHQKLQVKLDECGSCGYRWETKVKPDPKVLTRRPQGHEGTGCEPPCVGGSGTTIFRYTGRAAGRTTLRLEYIGAGKSKPSKTFRLTVRVR